MTHIIYEAYTYFEHLYVVYREGGYVVRSCTDCEGAKPYTCYIGKSLEDCINFVKEEEIKDLERRF